MQGLPSPVSAVAGCAPRYVSCNMRQLLSILLLCALPLAALAEQSEKEKEELKAEAAELRAIGQRAQELARALREKLRKGATS